jgi:hypothetical protein
MTDAIRFRQELLRRILKVTHASSIGLAVAAAAGCGSSVNVAPPGSGGSSGGRGGAGGGDAGVTTSTGGSGGGFIITTSSSSSSSSSSSGMFDAGTWDAGDGSPQTVMSCIESNGAPCPDAMSAGSFDIPPCWQVLSVDSGPTPSGSSCCYEITVQPYPCYVGRTFFIDEGVVKADLRRGSGWRAKLTPDVGGMNEATRRALADAWARDGLFEHASVASFSRFAMQMLAVGAPADLVRDIHAACVDEVHHAELCLALASGYEGASVEPGPLPFPGPMAIEPDLPAIARETVWEGCVGETVATVQAMEALRDTTDPAVREVLEITVRDETRHAELAWRFVAWALEVGGDATRAAVIDAFATFSPPEPRAESLDGVCLATYAAHGRQRAAEARAIASRVLAEVVTPAACALLDKPRRRAAPAEAPAPALA